jgi:hypothetical protein
MTLGNTRSGASYVPEYQISGLPFVTASSATNGTATRVDFPFVTSQLEVRHPGGAGALRVGFTANGVLGTNYLTVNSSGSWKSDLRLKTLFITSTAGTTNFEVCAGLTQIATREFPVLTGSSGLVAASGSFGYAGGGLG